MKSILNAGLVLLLLQAAFLDAATTVDRGVGAIWTNVVYVPGTNNSASR